MLIKEKVHITGIGDVLLISLSDNSLSDSDLPDLIGSIINSEWEVMSIHGHKTLMGTIKDDIGLVVKKYT